MADFKLKRKFDSFVPLATLKQHKDTELAGENLLHCGACVSDVLVFTGSYHRELFALRCQWQSKSGLLPHRAGASQNQSPLGERIRVAIG